MMNDSTNQKERKWTYIVFFLIGILSLPLGVIFGRLLANNIEGMWQLVFPFIICSILFAIALYAFKVRSAAFALKALAISFGFLFLIYVSWFMWSTNEHESGAISITKFDTPHREYSELTADELKGYPALENKKQLKGSVPLFKINEKYYEIGFMMP